ncbi:MAG: hypothetical protein LBK73_12640 [Treponema sp.]|nr:hypothetical protein [Treponema sp.]
MGRSASGSAGGVSPGATALRHIRQPLSAEASGLPSTRTILKPGSRCPTRQASAMTRAVGAPDASHAV